jgi:hypothetical protein
MEADGNFVLYDGFGNVAWASNTSGNPGARAHILMADLYIENIDRVPIATFKSNTVCP